MLPARRSWGSVGICLLGAAALGACGGSHEGSGLPIPATLFAEARTAISGGAGRPAEQVAVGDVDGDGDVDLVLAHDQTLTLLLNDGSARFTDASHLVPQPTSTISAVLLQDLDADGFPDLLVADAGSPGQAVVPGSGALDTEITDDPGTGSLLTFSPVLTNRRLGAFSEGLLKLDLSPLPPAIEVQAATLELFVFAPPSPPAPPPAPLPTDEPIAVFRNLVDFDATTVTFATWHQHPQPTRPVPEDVVVIPQGPVAVGPPLSFDVTALVQDWVGGHAPNFGVTVRRDPPLPGGGMPLASANSPLPGTRPQLRVAFETARDSVLHNPGIDAQKSPWQGFVDPDAGHRLPTRTIFHRTSALAPVDLDGDLLPDLVALGRGTRIEVLENVSDQPGAAQTATGTAAFLEVPPPPFHEVVRAVATIDVDADQAPDLLIGTPSGVKLLRNLGGFLLVDESAARLPALPPFSISSIRVLDVDGDGALEVLLLTDGADAPRLLRCDGAGGLVDATQDLSAPGLRGVSAAVLDLDLDGALDVVIVDPLLGARALRGTTAGGLVDMSGALPEGLPSDLRAIAAADLDGDQRTDLVVIGGGGSAVLLRR